MRLTVQVGVTEVKSRKYWIWEVGFAGERSLEEEKGIVNGGEVRLLFWVWEDNGKTMDVLLWKASKSYKTRKVCVSLCQVSYSPHIWTNLLCSGWVCNLTTYSWWVQYQSSSCWAKAAACGWIGSEGLMPTTVSKTANFHGLICGKSFNYSQPSMSFPNHLFRRQGSQGCGDTPIKHRVEKVSMWTV